MEDLLIIHILFVTICACASFLYGEWSGRKKGQQEMVFDMLERKLVTIKQLNKEYIDWMEPKAIKIIFGLATLLFLVSLVGMVKTNFF